MATALTLAWDLCGVDFDHASPPPLPSKPKDAYLSCRPLPPFVVNGKMHTCLAGSESFSSQGDALHRKV